MASITGIGLTTLNIFSPMFTFGGLSGGGFIHPISETGYSCFHTNVE